MPTVEEWQHRLWKSLTSDRTVMLGLADVAAGYPRPMTVQTEGEHGPIWFFTAKDTELVKLLSHEAPAIATYASKGHDVFATIHGRLAIANDRSMIDRLWNRFVAAWYEHGKDDPQLTLLRFDVERAEVWDDASSTVAGVKMLLGIDPKKDYQKKTADIPLS